MKLFGIIIVVVGGATTRPQFVFLGLGHLALAAGRRLPFVVGAN